MKGRTCVCVYLCVNVSMCMYTQSHAHTAAPLDKRDTCGAVHDAAPAAAISIGRAQFARQPSLEELLVRRLVCVCVGASVGVGTSPVHARVLARDAWFWARASLLASTARFCTDTQTHTHI